MKLQYLIFLLLLFSCSEPKKTAIYQIEGKTMGTTYHIKIAKTENLPLDTMREQIEKLLIEINQEMSTYIPDSTLAKINSSIHSDWHPISKEMYLVLKTANEISAKSYGAYDVTVGSLVNLWGFGITPDIHTPPEKEKIQDLLKNLGWEKMQLQEKPYQLKKINPQLTIDLSSVAKGYAVDRLAQLLEQSGIVDFMVEIGGEVVTKGDKNGEGWKIAIENPVTNQQSIHKVLKLRNLAMATSGDYRNFFEKDGKRYSHTIDARTGYPINHRLASVTIIAENCMLADGWATALNVLGEIEGVKLAESLDIKAYFIYKEGDEFKIKTTTSFNAWLEGNKE